MMADVVINLFGINKKIDYSKLDSEDFSVNKDFPVVQKSEFRPSSLGFFINPTSAIGKCSTDDAIKKRTEKSYNKDTRRSYRKRD